MAFLVGYNSAVLCFTGVNMLGIRAFIQKNKLDKRRRLEITIIGWSYYDKNKNHFNRF